MRLFAPAVSVILLLFHFSTVAQTDRMLVDLVLPTDNDALFSGGGPAFYQYIERNHKGVKSTPWEGGRYGFVRDPTDSPAGTVYTRFHEGIDIKPVHRDANGEPLAVMGYTGKGINRERAHVHLELNLLRSHKFESWHDTFFKNDPNHNGIYNGMNLAGLDIARLYLALRKNPSLTIPQFFESEEVFYKVVLPRSSHFELPKLYPWLMQAGAGVKMSSWEVSFARSGLPLKIQPSEKQVAQPELSYVKETLADAVYFTQDVVAGRGANAHLTENGRQVMRLWIWPD